VNLQERIRHDLDEKINQNGKVNKQDIINITKKAVSDCNTPLKNINVLVEGVEEYLKENYEYDNILNEYVDIEY
jgi:hypothetical protein